MADRYPKPTGNQSTSLLVYPPSSGFSFNELSGNALLIPVSQNTTAVQPDVGVGEPDNFLGQNSSNSPVGYFQTSKEAKEITDPFAQIGKEVEPLSPVSPTPVVGAACSNLHMPLRAVDPLPPSTSTSTNSNLSDGSKTPSTSSFINRSVYKPVLHHWFYCKEIEKKKVWLPFSLIDSVHLEDIFNSDHKEDIVVPTDGGRYDVHLDKRLRYPLYWEEDPTPVRRCSWFYRGDGEKKSVPYEEGFAEKLEEEYRTAMMTNSWYRRLEFPGGETIIMHNPQLVVHFLPSKMHDEWGNAPHDNQLRPRVVKRGVEDFDNIDDGEAMRIDHLVFVVHGIGGFCDLKFRTVTEVVDDFRSIANGLLHTHFRKHVEEQTIGRVEFLPISWHKTLHGDNTGIDAQLHPITLPSIPKLRYFSNDTILDVLFYTSPVYCQTIVDQVGSEINRMYRLFLERNPAFDGNVSLVGHSLGSVILFDVLLHQRRNPNDDECYSREQSPQHSSSLVDSDSLDHDSVSAVKEEMTMENFLESVSLSEYTDRFLKEKIEMDSLLLCSENDLKEMDIPLGPRKKLLMLINERNKIEEQKKQTPDNFTAPPVVNQRAAYQRRQSLSTVNYMVGLAGTGQPFISYPRLDFNPSCFFAVGSPTAMFLTVRGLHTIGRDFKLPTCDSYFNIFHPFDPVAYRMEPLVDPTFTAKPVLIPHHKGRKRMHLEIKESLARVGSDLKQMLMDSFKSTWNSINEFAKAHRNSLTAEMEAEMNKMVASVHLSHEDNDESDAESIASQTEVKEENFQVGRLNAGRRFDYVLQEKPIESFNEYLFALQSHMCYWESEDTVLLVLSEIYATMGISPIQPNHRPLFSSTEINPWNSADPSSTRVHRETFPIYKSPSTSASSINQSLHQSFPQTQTLNPSVFSPPYGFPQPLPFSSIQTPQHNSPPLGVDPTSPVTNFSVGPPPLSGFVRQKK
uniref:DDHD domain-containing protein n=1 Tax=Strigamia maritima TaxID=126957 RepID=T1JH84_STRMM